MISSSDCARSSVERHRVYLRGCLGVKVAKRPPIGSLPYWRAPASFARSSSSDHGGVQARFHSAAVQRVHVFEREPSNEPAAHSEHCGVPVIAGNGRGNGGKVAARPFQPARAPNVLELLELIKVAQATVRLARAERLRSADNGMDAPTHQPSRHNDGVTIGHEGCLLNLRCRREAAGLPQPVGHPVPSGENLGHQPHPFIAGSTSLGQISRSRSWYDRRAS